MFDSLVILSTWKEWASLSRGNCWRFPGSNCPIMAMSAVTDTPPAMKVHEAGLRMKMSWMRNFPTHSSFWLFSFVLYLLHPNEWPGFPLHGRNWRPPPVSSDPRNASRSLTLTPGSSAASCFPGSQWILNLMSSNLAPRKVCRRPHLLPAAMTRSITDALYCRAWLRRDPRGACRSTQPARRLGTAPLSKVA